MIKFFKSLFESPNQNSIEGVKLEKGEKFELKIPEELLKNETWRISKWYVQTGDIIKPGTILCKIESKNKASDFESFLEGKIQYRNTAQSTLNKDYIIAEIVGIN